MAPQGNVWGQTQAGSLPTSLEAKKRGLHAGPLVQATSADLDVRQDSLCFPIAQIPAADWQPCQKSLFVNETLVVRRPGGRKNLSAHCSCASSPFATNLNPQWPTWLASGG
jgi:hypothetical protein